jgi:hypothetical protein
MPVIYPASVKVSEQGHATDAYSEQSVAKTQMALLEDLEPMSRYRRCRQGSHQHRWRPPGPRLARVGDGYTSSETGDTPQRAVASASNTILPPTMVSSARVLPMPDAGTVKMSCDSTTRSA